MQWAMTEDALAFSQVPEREGGGNEGVGDESVEDEGAGDEGAGDQGGGDEVAGNQGMGVRVAKEEDEGRPWSDIYGNMCFHLLDLALC